MGFTIRRVTTFGMAVISSDGLAVQDALRGALRDAQTPVNIPALVKELGIEVRPPPKPNCQSRLSPVGMRPRVTINTTRAPLLC